MHAINRTICIGVLLVSLGAMTLVPAAQAHTQVYLDEHNGYCAEVPSVIYHTHLACHHTVGVAEDDVIQGHEINDQICTGAQSNFDSLPSGLGAC